MALSENFGDGSNLDSSKILENLNLDSKNSETEWVQVSSKNGKNQENETKKYSFFYKKNELTLSGNHISKPDSNPFLVSDQQINNTFPIALGFKALNNNKEFLVIMGDFAQKIQEKAQEPEEQTDQNRKNLKENDSETNKEKIYHPFLFSDEEKPVIKQEQNSKPTKKLSEIIEEFKKKSGISEVIFLTSTNQDRKIGTGLGKENYDALINSSNSVTNALITDTKNLVKKIETNNSRLNSPLVVDVSTGLYFEDQTIIEIEGKKLEKLRLEKIPKQQKDEISEDNDKPESVPEVHNKNDNDINQDQDKIEKKQDEDIPNENKDQKPNKNGQELDKEKDQKPKENEKKPTENDRQKLPEKSEPVSNLVRFGFWNIDKYGFSKSRANKESREISNEEAKDDSGLELIFEVLKQMNTSVIGLVLKDVSKKNIDDSVKKIVQKLDEIKNKTENKETAKTPLSSGIDSENLRRTYTSQAKWQYQIYDEDEAKTNQAQDNSSQSDNQSSRSVSKRGGRKKTRTGRRKFLFLYDSSIWKIINKQANEQLDKQNPFITSKEKIGNTERTWRNPPVGITLELLENRKNKEKALKNSNDNQVTFVLGSFDSEGKGADEKQVGDTKSKRLTSSSKTRSKGKSRSRQNSRYKNTNLDNEVQSQESAATSRLKNTHNSADLSIVKDEPDFSKFSGQGAQELTEAQNLGATLDEIKKNTSTKNLLFAGTTNIKKRDYAEIFENLLKSYSQLMPTNKPTKIHKNNGYVDPMNSMFYKGEWGQPKIAKRIDWYGLDGYKKGDSPKGPQNSESLKAAFEKYVTEKTGTKKSKKQDESPNWEPQESLSKHAPIVVEIDFESKFDSKKLKEELDKEEKE
ncbi:Uncharacterised protein [Mesomycoplasma dispar]|uniref:Uncharacterized protein n=1 Tax=Mesomycoplasma dispar TaxID=86660 RepID=A0AAJ5TCQ2_9BACT|nr:hypothetical protein [Mesomycoplasma dispar]AJR12584.1 hypothetical protein MDIS_02900 [Mesomycoplasma dispar]VEU62117.1 Uncharacterised protein [Mesomycoplasma dispar]